MAASWASTRLSRTFLSAALVLGYTASAAFSTLAGGPFGQGATTSTAGGFLAAAFILLPGPWRLGAAALCFGAQLLIGLAAGAGAGAFLAPVVNLVEAVVAAWLAAKFCGARSRRLSLRKLTLILLGAVAPAAATGALVGGALVAMFGGRDFVSAWTNLVIPGVLGMAIVLPALLLVARTDQYRDFQRTRTETFALLTGVCVLTALVFSQSVLPLYFLIFPALTLVAFRLGPAGEAVAGFLVAVIALPLTLLGHGPAMLAAGVAMIDRVRLTQLFLAAALFTGVTTAAALADQARLRRLMLGRDRAARSARIRAREAERIAAVALERVRAPTLRKRVAHPV
jgi:integral membrane sensor domain MASE1